MWDLDKLFSASFMPHGHCYLWQPSLIALHVGSDLFIALAYYSIPICLVHLVRSCPHLKFDWMLLLFASFIFACGTTHVLEILTVWQGLYWLQGVVKLATAVVSVITAVLLWPLVPKLASLPSSARLQEEIEERERIQELLQRSHDNLEARVTERTIELQRSNNELKEKTEKLQRYYDVTVDRELQMLQLKEEINTLLAEMNRPTKYRVVRVGESAN
ncbi:MAG: hypothetical protein U0136_19860 [Bdellovibrionota bacterium]